MNRILLLSLLLLPIVALAQYPTFSNKQKLGVQTTGDGLIFRGNQEVPNYIPSNVNNAYFYLDTVRNTLKFYKDYWIQIYPTPQFDTTTLNVYLKISDTTAMLLPYFRDSDTTSLNLINRFALKLNISDTATMLTPYMKKADTISLSNRIDLKLNISDTTILSNRITTNANNIITINNKLATKLDTVYVKFKNVVTRLLNKDTINIGSSLTDGYAINIIGDSVNIDTVILDVRYPDRDSTNELQDITFATTSGIVTISGGKVMNLDTLYSSVIDSVNLLIRDSIAAFTPLTEGYGINIIGDSINVDTTVIFTQSDTITLSNRIDTKLNASDTASLSNRINLKLNISDTTNMLAPYLREADTTSLSNRINTKIDTIYVNYQTNVDVVTNKDTININPQLTEGFGINIIGNSINIDSAVILETQQKQIAYVKNMSGVTIYKGQAVYSSGSSGGNKLVTLASSSTEQASSKTFGVVESDSIPNGSHGYIITFGLLSGINTNLLTEGLSIYLSNTPGQLTTTKPQAPLHMVVIGVCIRQQQNNGSIFVKIQNGFEFDELHDVRITTPVDKSSVYYNLSENLWRDTTAALLVSDTATMLNPYLRKLDTITLSNRINLKFNTADTSILGYVTTYSNQLNINGNKTFNNTVSVDSLNATKQAKIQSLTVGKGGYTITGGTPGAISSTAFGFEALKNNTSGDWNTAIGYQALLNNDTAWNNVAIGNNSLNTNISGQYNTAIGVESLFSNKVGNNNVAIGYYAGTTNKGNNNIYIGNQTYHTDSVNNVLMIGGINTPLLSGIITGNKKLGVNVNPLNLTNTFEVNSPISNAVKINSNTNSTNLELMNSGGSVFIKSGNKNMTLQTDTTALVYLKGDVNKVGILTMNPQQALQVAGTIRVDSLSNNLTPDKLVGANNSNDLTDIKIGNGLSFSNDTLKVADNIINSGDTATLLRQDFLGINTNVLTWQQGSKKLLPYFTQVYRNGQLLKSESQYTITNDSIVTLATGSFKLDDNITIIAIDNVIALAGGGTITLQGDISGSGTNTITTTIGTGKVLNSMLAGSITNDKLDVITATNKVSNSATTATSANTGNTIVSRDGSGNFSAGTITASLNGNAATVTTNANLTGDVTSTGNATSIATGVIVNTDISASAAIAVSKLAASTISGVTLGNNLNTLTISSPLTGTSYNGSSAVSIGIPAATGSINGYLTSTDWTTFNNKQSQISGTGFVKATGTSITYDNSSYLRTGLADSTYLKLTGGTLSGNLYGINQGLSTNLTISDIIPGNSAPLFTTITTGPSSSETVRFGLNQSLSGGANMFMGGTQGLGGNPTNPSIFFTDSRKAYASIGGIHTSGGSNNQSGHIVFSTTPSLNTIALTERMRIAQDGAITMGGTLGVTGATTLGSTLNVTSSITGNSFIKSGGTSSQFLKADGSVDNNTYLTTSLAASTYLPLTGGTLTGTINRQEGSHDGSASTFYYNILNYFAKRDNNKGGQTAQITFTDRPGTATFENNVRTSDIYLMTAKNFSGGQLGQYLDTTLSVVANQDGGRIGISKLNPSYKLDVNGTFNASGNSLIGGTLGVSGATNISNTLSATTGTFTGLNVNNTNVNGEGILTLKSYNFNFANKIQFGDGAVIRREIIYPNSSSNMQFRSYPTGTAQGGYEFYVSNGSSESLAATIGTDKSLSLTGTLGVTGATTISNTLSTTSYAALDAGNNTHRLTNTLSGNQTWTPSAGFITSYFNNNASGGWYYNTAVDNSGFPILSILSTSNDRKKSGITLNSQGTANGTYTPAITFSSLSNSTSYYSAYAAIIGKKTGIGGATGTDSNWNTGHIEFYGTTQATDVNGGVMLNSPSMTLGVGVGIGYSSPPTILGRLTVSERVGVATNDPTNTVDINGTLRVRTTNTVTSTALLGRDNNGVVGGVIIGSGLTLSNSTLSLSASSGGFITTNSNYTVTITDTWIVFNNNFNNITVTLPDATTSTGRTLYFRNTAAGSIVSAGAANVINNTVTTGTPTNDILGAGNTNVKWCTLVSNGQYWIKMQAGSL